MKSVLVAVAVGALSFMVTRDLLERRRRRQRQREVYKYAYSMVAPFKVLVETSPEYVCATLVEISYEFPELMPDAARCVLLFGGPMPMKVVYKGETDSSELVDAEKLFSDIVQRMHDRLT